MSDPRKQKKTYTRRSVITTAVVFALVGMLAGYLVSGGKGTPSTVTLSLPSASLAPPQSLPVGQTGTAVTGTKVTVKNWAYGATGWPAPPAGQELSHSDVTFCSGQGVASFRIKQIPLLFTLVDASGQDHAAMVDETHSVGEFASWNVGLLPPGACLNGTMVFSTPIGTSLSAVRFTGASRFDWNISELSAQSPAPQATASPASPATSTAASPTAAVYSP